MSVPASDSPNPYPMVLHPHEGTPDPVDSVSSYDQAVTLLSASSSPVAVDVERAAGYRYSDRAYLIQIRREDVGTFLFDPPSLLDSSQLATGDLRALNAALGNHLWILHSAHQDLKSLKEVGLVPPRLFDTEIAARLLGLTRFSLVAVCEQELGLSLAKDHQAADWSVRPLPRAWLRYAALDVELLTALYERLSSQLRERGRWQWAQEEFSHVLTCPAKEQDPQRWRSTPGAGKINTPRGLAALEELWRTREAIAADSDIAAGRLVPHRVLVQMAMHPPRNKRQLMNIEVMRKPNVRNHAKDWLEALNRAKFRPEQQLPSLKRRVDSSNTPTRPTLWKQSHPQAFARLQCIRAAVKGVCQPLGLEPEVVFEPRIQRQLAWTQVAYRGQDFQTYLLRLGARPWQVDLCATAIERSLRDCRS
ncbi:MAG: HRDC domain-containing protein [Actinomycetaceae bacterium]|nr:HRDC domain-containing protein [Actinomycetaceae bacterium]